MSGPADNPGDSGTQPGQPSAVQPPPNQPPQAQAQVQSQGAQQPAAQQPPVQPQTDEWQFRLNRWLIWFLGVGLLAALGGILYLSIDRRPIPDALTSFASLIGGGLLAFLNPVGGVTKRSGSSDNAQGSLGSA